MLGWGIYPTCLSWSTAPTPTAGGYAPQAHKCVAPQPWPWTPLLPVQGPGSPKWP